MFNMKHMKIAIVVLTVSILGTSALIVNSGNMAYAQTDITTNTTTTTIDTDSLIKDLKARHPILAQRYELDKAVES